MILVIIIAVATFAGSYFVVGLSASLCVTAMGRLGRNRNVAAGAFLSALAALGGAAIFRWPLVSWAMRFLDVEGVVQWGLDTTFGGGVSAWVFTIIGAALAALTAYVYGSSRVEGMKFCEKCDCFMRRHKLPQMSMEDAEKIVKAFSDAKTEEVAEIIQASFGAEIKAMLYACPLCRKGYLELPFQAVAVYGGKKSKTGGRVEAAWLAGSWQLEPELTESILPHALKKP